VRAEPDADAFCQRLIAEFPRLFAGVDERIRDEVLSYNRPDYGWGREVRVVLASGWPDGPEAAVRDAVKELGDCLIDRIVEFYDPSNTEWLTPDERTEWERKQEAACTIRAELSTESLAALVRAASGVQAPEA